MEPQKENKREKNKVLMLSQKTLSELERTRLCFDLRSPSTMNPINGIRNSNYKSNF